MSSARAEADISVAGETTPLLVAVENPDTPPGDGLHEEHRPGSEDIEEPLPMGQILLLCYARLVDPIAFFSIFPFINKMIHEEAGVPETDVGFYAGLIESLFSMTQMLVMIGYGRVADRIGRKPVLVFSLCGVSVASAMFGLSKGIWQMILFRCLAGAFAGSVVTIRAMISENSTARTQAKAFTFFSFAGNIGIFLGPLIGGSLSEPTVNYPSVFEHIHLFKTYPYLLPTLITGCVAASAAVLCALFVKETLITKTERKSSGSLSPPMSTWEVIKSPGVAVVLYLTGHMALIALGYTAVVPLFWFTSVDLGGLAFTPLQISFFLGLAGLSQAIWLFPFPALQRRYGTGGVLRACTYIWPIFMALNPVGNFMLKQGWTTAFWIMMPSVQFLGASVSLVFTAMQLALNDVAPAPNTLGTLNAIFLTLSSGLRAVAPGVFSSVFAVGARTQVLGGQLIWVIIVCLTIGFWAGVRYLPEKAVRRIQTSNRQA
ncbi:major facilitator superfamily domain-containing protein [Mycena rebaudengoi]|nr:major facilitator superfamily domain-containing protein [Mycena rebaudengoi]KAJ7277719.1 major facilitator superfamily domain-containing protein [Mycena rebaudengoi]